MKPSNALADDRLKSKGSGRRIGLLSPYSGGNLGNTAILAAMIANTRVRIPGVEIVGITLAPEDTRRRLGIQTFPLAGVSRPYYTLISEATGNGPHAEGRSFGQIREWAKRIPLFRGFVRSVRTCVAELAHIVKAARFIRTLDQVVVTGGGALDESWGGPWGHPWSLLKWSVISRFSKIPLLFVSVGKSFLERPLSRLFVRGALSLAAYRSYRDLETKVAIQTLIDASNDPVYPDLAFSYPCESLQASEFRGSGDGRLVVGVSPIAYCDPRVWPEKHEERYATYVRQLAEMVQWLIRENCRVLMFTTDSPDMTTVQDVLAQISRGGSDTDAVQVLPGSTDLDVESFLKKISHVDLTIASRLHGVILSHLNATPVLALSFDPKVDAHMSAMQQSGYCLSIDRFQVAILIDRFNALKAARERERAHLRSTAVRFRQLLNLQYDKLLGAVQTSPCLVAGQTRFDDFSPLPIGDLSTK